MPHASPLRIDITITIVYSPAGAVPYPLRALHVAYESCFLEETVSAHPAPEERSLDQPLAESKKALTGMKLPERTESRLPAAYRSEQGHQPSDDVHVDQLFVKLLLTADLFRFTIFLCDIPQILKSQFPFFIKCSVAPVK